MSKMKHLLRKLHIGGGGGGINDHHHHHHGPVANPNASPSLSPSVSPSNGRIGTVESGGGDRAAGDGSSSSSVVGGVGGGGDFNFFEEEFQVQLALAISASDPDSREDPESAQIDAAKRISLGCCSMAPVTNADALVEFLSLRYWSYSVVNYNEKVMDGFYDVYGINSNSVLQGKMPQLADLQAISISDNVDYEVILVNRFIDPELRELEKRAHIMSVESQVSGSLVLSGLIQKIADIVVDRMGGPVGDADEMSRRWNRRSHELRSALNTIILPLGCLDVGLSRHRALLFKVLADRIDLPCMLVKGSYYTGTDDGAVNLIQIDGRSEYIIDLMGAPGTLIPTEVPSSHLTNAGFDMRGFVGLTEAPTGLSSLLGEEPGSQAVSPNQDRVSPAACVKSAEASFLCGKTNEGDVDLVEKNQIERFEHEFGKVFSSSQTSYESPQSAEKIKVNNVSKYVISAAKNPEFAQKLHAVLLESGALPPPDLFLDIPLDLGKQKFLTPVHHANGVNLDDGLQSQSDKLLSRHGQFLVSLTGEDSLNYVCCNDEQEKSTEVPTEQHRELETNVLNSEVSFPSDTTSEELVLVNIRTKEKSQINAQSLDMIPFNLPGMLGRAMRGNEIHESSLPSAMGSSQLQPEHALIGDDKWCFVEKKGRIFNKETGKESVVKLMETANNGQHIACNGYIEAINPVLGEVAEWEIRWEDLQIGERIGIGSYGEVYRADWNGTEVAVKKFLEQDFSGDALVQFKCEAEIMLRLRHPNVVLFMGAVTRPPHMSILTEFLPRGSLYKLLHRPNSQLDERRRMRMALDVAKGMNYLHTSHPPIVHRDLKSPNLLVDKNWVVKVCDFGLSRMKHHTFLSSKSTAGTPEWMAPEVLRNEPANEKCDVYSFGVILWELATCQIPWKGLNPMQVVGAVGFQNRRLEIPTDIDPAVAQIILDCWQMDSHLRPSFSQIISRLRRVQRLLVERTNHTSQTTE